MEKGVCRGREAIIQSRSDDVLNHGGKRGRARAGEDCPAEMPNEISKAFKGKGAPRTLCCILIHIPHIYVAPTELEKLIFKICILKR